MNTEVIRKDWEGSVVNERYCLVKWLGSCGQSGVYLCSIDGNEERKAAIKLFPASVAGAAACAAGWAAVAGLSHPHLLRLLDSGRAQIGDTAVLFVVCDYSDEILSEILGERALTLNETKEMMPALVDALGYLHQKGMVHGRIKPSNIMAIDDQLKLASDSIRAAGTITPPEAPDVYDAPEKERGTITSATDMWSLGMTLVEALTQKPPVWNPSGQSDPLVPPSVPEPFAQIAKDCLRVDPANRCTLDGVRARLDSGAAIPPPPAETNAAWKPIHVSRRVSIASMLLLAAIGFAAIEMHRTKPSAPAPDDQPSAPAPAQTSQPPQTTAPETAPAQSAPNDNPPPSESPSPSDNASPSRAESTPEPAPANSPSPDKAPSGPSTKGTVVERVMPDVPEKAIRTIHGKFDVSIRVNVNASGAVDDASIVSQGPSKYFANLALAAARNWKFTPARVIDQGMPSVWLLHFQFRQSGADVTPTQEWP